MDNLAEWMDGMRGRLAIDEYNLDKECREQPAFFEEVGSVATTAKSKAKVARDKLELIKAKIEPRFTPHDLRRTFVTRLNGAGVRMEVVEKTVNHSLQGMLAVYNQHEYTAERIDAFKEMERLILEITRQ